MDRGPRRLALAIFLNGLDGDLIYLPERQTVLRAGADVARSPPGDLKPSLTTRHVTTYRYRQPVAFGEHRRMLLPRDSHDQKVIDATLEISPTPSNLRFTRDAFGNHVAIRTV
jgi:hypothetical protein